MTASFAVDTFTLTYVAGPNGTITGAASQTVAYGAAGTLVTAMPNVGYHFVSWSDGVLTAARTDTNVTANLAVDRDLRGRHVHADLLGRLERHADRRGVTDGGVRRSGHPGHGGTERGLSLRELE